MTGSLSASGRWSQSESEHHINYLELLASFHAHQCFVSNPKSIHVRLAVYNSTAVAYINNLGGTRSPLLDSLSRPIWVWCKSRDILITAQHKPGKVNTRADTLSREITSNLEWSLYDDVFLKSFLRPLYLRLICLLPGLMQSLTSLSLGTLSQVQWL